MIYIGDFFDTLADRWDELCTHDSEKLNYIINESLIRPGIKILDVGCGTGILESFLLTHCPEKIVAVDLSPKMIEKARLKYGTPLVDFRCMDVADLTNETFDLIFAYSVYPHFEEPGDVLKKLSNLLNPNGELVICHSESRSKINGHHQKNAGKQSEGLPPVHELAELMKPWFDIRHMEDNDKLYMINGIKK